MNLFDEPQEDERGEGGGRDGDVNVLYREVAHHWSHWTVAIPKPKTRSNTGTRTNHANAQARLMKRSPPP